MKMTSAFVLAVGSRGDTEPTIALAQRLLNHFQAVHLFHHLEYDPIIPSDPRLISHHLPFSLSSFRPILTQTLLKFLIPSIFTGFDMIKIQTAALAKFTTYYIIPTFPYFVKLAEQHSPSVIIATTLGFTVAASVADKRGIPLCVLNFQPNTPTPDYPYYMHGTESALLAADEIVKIHQQQTRRAGNDYLESYLTQYSVFSPSLPELNELRTSHGLDKIRLNDIEDNLCGKTQHVHVINSFCKPLVPGSSHHTENIHIVPPLASGYIPEDWNPEQSCPEVNEFLAEGRDKPICITFGSMGAVASTASVTRSLLSGLRSAGVERALILNTITNIGPDSLWRFRDADLIDWTKERVLVTKEAPQFAWLLPRCKAIICHGGAGTTFAGLRAGIPVIVSPVLCDQFFWGRLVERLGLGAVAGSRLERASSTDFEQAIRKALAEEVVDRVRKFGEDERSGDDGALIAADIIGSMICT